MRFAEFKILLEAEEARKVYSIGDSHAEGLAYAKGVINRANGGVPSTHKNNFGGQHTIKGSPVGLDTIPPNQIVLVAQGANDTANSARAHIDSKGKTPLKSPQKIANDVSAVVNAAKANGHIVVFVLFPNGEGRAPGLAKYYSGDYQEDVRDAIKNAVGVPVVDLQGKGLSPDGIHATANAYQTAAQEAIRIARSQSAPAPSKKKDAKAGQGAMASTKPDTGKEATQLEVPNGRVGPEVADIQKVLIALGYKLPKHGVDGVRGSETSGAVKEFQQANNLTVDGDPGPETVAALNKVMKQKGISIAKSTSADVKGNVYGTRDIDDEDIKKLDPLPDSKDAQSARDSAEKYLGRRMSDDEWNYLLRATAAESSFNKEEYAMVMGSILNRARDYGKNGVISALLAPNQFQAVTGTAADGHKPSANFVRGPNSNQMKMMIYAAVNILPRVSHSQRNFTAANPAAYGPGTNIGYLHKMVAQGGSKIGGTVFNTALV